MVSKQIETMATCRQSHGSFGNSLWDQPSVSFPVFEVRANKEGAAEQSEERTTLSSTSKDEERRKLFQKFENSLGFTYDDLLSYHSDHPDFMTPEVEEAKDEKTVEEAKEEKTVEEAKEKIDLLFYCLK